MRISNKIILSNEQIGIYNTQLMFLDDPMFNYGIAIAIPPIPDFASFVQSIMDTIPILTAKICNSDSMYISHTLASELLNVNSTEIIEELIKKEMNTAFCIDEESLCKILYYKVSSHTGTLFIKVHHIIFDGMSVPLLVNTIFQLLAGEAIQKFEIPQSFVSSSIDDKCQNYWTEKLDLLDGDDTLETAIQRKGNSNKTKFIDKIVPAQAFDQICKRCLNFGISITQYIVGCFGILNRLYGNDNLKIGLPLNIRPAKSKTIGCAMNVVPLITTVDDIHLELYMKQIQTEMFSIYRSKNISVMDIQKLSRSNKMPYNVTLSIMLETTDKIPSDNVILYTPFSQQEDLTIYFFKLQDDSIQMRFTYKESAFEEYVVEQMINHFCTIMNNELDMQNSILKVPFMSETEKKQLANLNSTECKQDFVNICSLLSSSAQKYADKIAITFESENMTYEEFQSETDRLASLLKKVAKNNIIGVCMNRSLELIISLFGILKAGLIYLPIDPAYPEDRIQYILQDSEVDTLLVNSHNTEYYFARNNINYIDLATKPYLSFERISKINILPDDPAYLIYTSGSTGNPKGVINTHIGLFNRVMWQVRALNYTSDTTFIQKTAYSFDVSMWELCIPFVVGGRLIVAKPDGHKDINYLIDTIMEQQISTIHFVPSMFEIFLANPRSMNCTSLSTIICSGEGLPKAVAKTCLNTLPNAKLYNFYGPTEAAIDVTYYLVNKDNVDQYDIVSIGKPIDNCRIYISNSNNIEMPLGIRGEILISGMNLATEYHNKAGLTKEKFTSNPFFTDIDAPYYARTYHSGDYGMKTLDGNIIFYGRMDNQIKLNGQRVELGEIESRIREIEKIDNVKVLIKKYGNLDYLVTYYTSTHRINSEILKKKLHNFLPAYMVPNAFICLEKFPLTPNGKLNIKYFESIPFEPEKNEHLIAPVNAAEESLLKTFKEILGRDDIGVENDFFEAGGDSLKAIELVSECDMVTLDNIYKNKTVRKIVADKNAGPNNEILKTLKKEISSMPNVICIPYGGGNPYIYTYLSDHLNANVFAVDLPGHHFGDSASQLISPDEIAKLCVREIIEKGIDNNLYIYGHCTGSSIAYALCRQLRTSSIKVERLIVGAAFPFLSKADQISQSGLSRTSNRDEAYSFIRALGGFKDDKINNQQCDEMINWFIHDAETAQKYMQNFDFTIIPKLDTPLICITSSDDFFTEDVCDSVKNWDYISNETHYYKFQTGGHYFIESRSEEVAKIIQSNF